MRRTKNFNEWADLLPPIKDFEKIKKIDKAWEKMISRHLALKNER